MTEHKISWLNMPGFKPETWNPIVGCSKVSPGCDNCYAEKQAFIRAFNTNTPQYESVIVKNPLDPRYRQWNGNTEIVYHQLNWTLVWKSPRMIFVCSMGDLFHESIPFEWLLKVFVQIQENPQHLFIVLTKRPDIMAKQIKRFYNVSPKILSDNAFLQNIWLGVTAENQEQANKRLPILLSIPAAKHFVSIEPMLGPVDLRKLPLFANHKLDWVICGGESGSKARPMHPDWVRSIRDQCKEAGTPFFFKQWGEWSPRTFDLVKEDPMCKKWPKILKVATNGKIGRPGNADDLTTNEYSNGAFMQNIGRNKAGNLLNDKQHHEWPISIHQ